MHMYIDMHIHIHIYICIYIERVYTYTWTSKIANKMDPILPIVSVLRYWSMILGSVGVPGMYIYIYMSIYKYIYTYIYIHMHTHTKVRLCGLLALPRLSRRPRGLSDASRFPPDRRRPGPSSQVGGP